MRRLGLVVALWSGVVFAQGGGPRVAPFPLQLRQGPPDFTATSLAELRADFVRLLRDSGVASPSSFELTSALERTQRQDCDVEDQCLAALAMRSSSLYATFVLLEWNLKDSVTVSGRVVRQDGQLAVPKKSVTLKFTKKEGFATAARLALRMLVMEQLKLPELPATKPTNSVEPQTPVDAGVPVVAIAPSVADAGVELPPPPPPPVVEPGPRAQTVIGVVAAGVGGAAAVTGLVVFLTGRDAAGAQLDDQRRLLPQGDRVKLSAATGQQGAGVGLLVGGLAVAAAGVVLAVLPSGDSKSSTTWWLAPMPGGAAVGVAGVLP